MGTNSARTHADRSQRRPLLSHVPALTLVRCACGRASDRPGAAVSTIIRLAGGDRVAEAVNINDVLDGHIVLDVECLDRIYLNGYVPNLQVPGQVVTFLTEHLATPSPHRPCSSGLATGFARRSAASPKLTASPCCISTHRIARAGMTARSITCANTSTKPANPEWWPSSWRKKCRRSSWGTHDDARPAHHSSASTRPIAG